MRYDYKTPKDIKCLSKIGSDITRKFVHAVHITDKRIVLLNSDNEGLGGIELENLDCWVVLGDSIE